MAHGIAKKNNGVLQQTSAMPREFPLELLQRITDNFSNERIIGRGAYGAVYKGVLDGKEIAVKKLYTQPGLGDDQFNECINLMRVQHQNIVRLNGYCYKTEKKICEYNGKLIFVDVEERVLCLEYLQGGSLDRYLSDEPCVLDWCICYGIIKGICEGLKYLHTGSKNPIYHMDLKPANILLDMDMIPKIGDFGLSRLLGSAQTSLVTQRTAGTLGYMPREYIDKQEITSKFDVFSLGVIILQIVAGRTGCSQRADMPSKEFIELVHSHWEKRLHATMSPDASWEVKICIEIALRCVEDDRAKRPTITEIVHQQNKIDTAKSSSTGQVIDFRSKQDSSEQCGNSENCGVNILVPVEDEQVPKTQYMMRTLDKVKKNKGNLCLVSLAIVPIVAVAIITIVVAVLRFAVVPKVKADIEDACLNSFALSTTLTDVVTMPPFLEYDISVFFGVRNTILVKMTNSLLLVDVILDGQRLHNATFSFRYEVLAVRVSGQRPVVAQSGTPAQVKKARGRALELCSFRLFLSFTCKQQGLL